MHPSRRVVAAALIAAAAGSAATAQVRLTAMPIAPSATFGGLTFVGQPPGETRRLYVGEQNGKIHLILDGVVQPTAFLDLTGQIVAGFESGLLGLAFHPDFQNNGYVYVYYTADNANGSGGHIVRYHTDPKNPDVVTPGSATEIMWISRSASINHQGGWIGFGPDGYLYHANGDAANSNNAPNINVLMGKILRIDVDNDDFPMDPVQNYAIPPTNPFAGAIPGRDEIWAFGLRNPWRCSFDRLTGDFWIGDVGAGSREEINFQPNGMPPFTARNYGWPCMEGNLCMGGACCTDPSLVRPIHDYPHPASAVIGGYVYRGESMPELHGTYFFGDLAGRMWSFRYDGTTITEFTDRTAELPPGLLRSFGEDSRGELYYCSGNRLFKIVRQCYANCDNSTTAPVLNVNDFLCFQSRFAAGDLYANCDESGIPPVLNVNDFLCFQSRFAAGCP